MKTNGKCFFLDFFNVTTRKERVENISITFYMGPMLTWYYLRYTGLNKNMLFKLISHFFLVFFFNVAIRKSKVIYVTLIIYLLNDTGLMLSFSCMFLLHEIWCAPHSPGQIPIFSESQLLHHIVACIHLLGLGPEARQDRGARRNLQAQAKFLAQPVPSAPYSVFQGLDKVPLGGIASSLR